MRFSIITVCFNAEKTINDTIQSVLKQTGSNIEYIVVDGGSTDSTVDIVKSNPLVTNLVSEPDNGIFDAMNKGLALSSGDVVAFLNADDLYISDDVIKIVTDVLSNSDVDACYSDLLYVDQANTNKVIRYWKSSEYFSAAFFEGWVPPHPTFFCKRVIFDRFGNFNPDYENASDFELLFRFIEINKIKTTYIPRPLVRMRMGGVSNNSISGILRQNSKIISILKTINPKFSITKFLVSKVISRSSQFLRRREVDF